MMQAVRWIVLAGVAASLLACATEHIGQSQRTPIPARSTVEPEAATPQQKPPPESWEKTRQPAVTPARQ